VTRGGVSGWLFRERGERGGWVGGGALSEERRTCRVVLDGACKVRDDEARRTATRRRARRLVQASVRAVRAEEACDEVGVARLRQVALVLEHGDHPCRPTTNKRYTSAVLSAWGGGVAWAASCGVPNVIATR
jgi:hypothetical protein